MSGSSDLYRIGLDPNNPDGSVPSSSAPNGSIGGSDIGANSQDDQRVRDLMQQYLEETTTVDFLNNLIIFPTPASTSGDGLLAEFYNSDDVVLIFGAPSGLITQTVTGQDRTVTFDGNPVRLQIGALFGVDYLPLVAGFVPLTADVKCWLLLYIDGSLTFETFVSTGMRFQVTSDELFDWITMRDTVLFEPGKSHSSLGGLFVTGAQITTRFAAGAHTIRVDALVQWSDDQFIQVEMKDEYYAFYVANSTKITSLQLFDAATIL